MTGSSVTHSTFVIERNYPAAPEKIFAAFADPARKQRWFTAGDKRDTVEFAMDFRVGGNERAVYRFRPGTQFAGTLLTNHTNYQDIVPNQRIVIAYTMSMGDRRFSASLATFELLPAAKGTDLVFTDQGAYFEGSDGPEIRKQGWEKLLERLAAELEQ